MKRTLVFAALAASSAQAAVVTSFEEASLRPEILLDIPNSSLGNIIFDAANDELDFTASGNTDLWGARNNAAIAWTAIPPGLVNGSTWTLETQVRINSVAEDQQVAAITFYGGPDGARPDISFGLDNWTPSARAVRLQGLGDNDPNTAILTTASSVYLRVVIQEGGATDTYNFYFKVNAGDAWQQIPGVAINYQTSFANTRVGLTYKTGAAKSGAAFTFFNVMDTSTQPPTVTTHPANTTAITGGVTRLRVIATGATSYQWRRNTENITTGGNSSVLVFDRVSAADNGASFDCIVTNANGSATSNPAIFTTTTPPPGSGYYSSAVQAEPSLFAYFPVDGSTSPAVTNVKNPAFSGTVNGDSAHDSNAARTIGARSVASNASGWIGVTKDPAWDFPDGTGTIEMWVYHTAAAGYNPSLIAVRNDSGGGTRYSFHADSAGTKIYYFNGGSAPTWNLPSNSIGRLMHLAMVINNGQCTLYHNGASLGPVAQSLGGGLNLPAEIGSAGPSTQESFPGSIDEVALYADPLPASAISAHYNAWLTASAGSAPQVSTQPQNKNANEGTSALFEVVLSNPAGANYRWQKNGADIPGATAPGYTLNPATLADHGAQFRCVIYNPYGGTLTNSATLSVNDLNAPVLVSASAPNSATQVILTFNEPVDLTGASFTLSTGTVLNAVAGPLPGMVTLTVSGLTAGAPYTVTVNNVRDLTGNALTTANTGFTAAPPPVPAPIELVRPAAEPIGPATRRGPFIFSEIHYHPRDRADLKNLEFIELYNSQPWAEDLTGCRITGEVSYNFPNGTAVPAGGRLVIAAAPADVQSAYSITGVLGPWTGSLNNSGGQLRLRDTANAVAFEVNYDSGPPWQPAADGAGHSLVLARPSYGMDDPKAWDISFNLDGSPGAAEPAIADPYRTVVINEVLAASPDGHDFIELYNYSASPVNIGNCSLSDDRDAEKYVIPAGTSVTAGGYLVFEQTTLGFALKASGDTVYFRAPGSGGVPGRVLDTVRFGPQLPTYSFARTESGSGIWRVMADPTPGAEHDSPFRSVAVISEICYNPPTGSAQLPFVELTNRYDTPVNLSGWRLRGGISYDFPAGTTLDVGASLAVSAFSGSLNGGTGERIRLEMPVTNTEGAVTETIYPVVDEVTYGTGGRWGRDSDGGGSSLELKNLLSDGRLAGNWADSREPAEQGWVTIQATGVMDNGSGVALNRLHVMMLGEGECLLDDVEVFQGAGSNTVTNAGFESGATGWLLQGTHDASTVEAGGFSGASAMHIRAAGRGDLSGNRLTVPLTTSLTANATATIRAKVKWLRGHPEILLRLAGGVLEATGNILPAASTPGTPGAANSTAAANAGPAISEVTHRPVLPPAGQPATVYAKLDDPDNITLAVLRYRLNPSSTLNTVPMSYRGAGIFSANIPAQNTGTLAAFTITAYDGAGAASTFPADGKECLVRWGEGSPAGNLSVYRLWMTEATRALWASRTKNNNTPLDITFVYNNSRIIYNASGQYSGSPWHTTGFNGPTGADCDYDCSVPPDDRFLGTTDFLLCGPGTFGNDASLIREQAIWYIARKIGLASIHRRFCRVMLNGVQRQTVFEDTQQPNNDWIAEYWPGDNDGHLHKAQDWIEFADDGATFNVGGTTTLRAFLTKSTTTGGAHKNSRYRYQWAARSVSGSANDWAPFDALVDAFNAGTSGTDPAFFNALDPLIDQDAWARALAVQRIAGNWDTWGYRYGKNMYIYKPAQGPWSMTAWDIDFSLGLSPGDGPGVSLEGDTQDPLCTKFRNQPNFRRAWWRAFRDAVDGPMVQATVTAQIDRMVAGLAANSISASSSEVTSTKNYIEARRNLILSELNTQYPGTAFALSGGSTINDADGIVTLTGTAPPQVKSFLINGVEYDPAWASQSAWNLTLTLFSATNNLTVQGLGSSGNVVGTFPVTINVTGPPPLPPVTINEWMADNASDGNFPDPADGNYEDWFELHNYGATPVNLGGFFLTDSISLPTQFTIPAGTTIPAGGYLLVWADDETDENGVTPGQIHANFKLGAGGEQLALYTPDGTQVDLIHFGAQTTNQSQGRYPDSTAGIVSPVPTPGKRNALTPDIIAITDAGAGTSAVTFGTEPTHVYQIESSTDLAAWSNWGAPINAAAATVNANLPRSDTRRFWRARIVVP